MQQIRHTIRSVGEWRRFLMTFAGAIVIQSDDIGRMQIRRQHAIAAVVLEFAFYGQMPRIVVGEDRVVIEITRAPNFAAVRR